jgi:hypothetical protein
MGGRGVSVCVEARRVLLVVSAVDGWMVKVRVKVRVKAGPRCWLVEQRYLLLVIVPLTGWSFLPGPRPLRSGTFFFQQP